MCEGMWRLYRVLMRVQIPPPERGAVLEVWWEMGTLVPVVWEGLECVLGHLRCIKGARIVTEGRTCGRQTTTHRHTRDHRPLRARPVAPARYAPLETLTPSDHWRLSRALRHRSRVVSVSTMTETAVAVERPVRKAVLTARQYGGRTPWRGRTWESTFSHRGGRGGASTIAPRATDEPREDTSSLALMTDERSHGFRLRSNKIEPFGLPCSRAPGTEH